VKYLGKMFDKSITWGLHIEMNEPKAFRTFIRIYTLFESEHSSANIKLTLYKSLISSEMTYARPSLSGIDSRPLPIKIAEYAEQGSL
jgi:hypothetical protein